MFSGKSTELLRRLSRYDAIHTPTLLINSSLDTRTGKSVKTHQNIVKDATKTNNLMDIIDTPEYRKCLVIGIDEAQFFPDLVKFVRYSERDKTIIIAGLDGDSERRPFGQILNCIPLCDDVIKLTAMDMMSNDGTPGIFSKRISNETRDQILVGHENKYISVSRKNYFT